MSENFSTASRLTAYGQQAWVDAKRVQLNGVRIGDRTGGTFEESYALAQQYDPGAVLAYIPIAERSECNWSKSSRVWSPKYGWTGEAWYLEHPKMGRLEWVSCEHPPRFWSDIKRTKLFVCRGYVASDVRTVVVESRIRIAEAAGVKWEDGKGFKVEWDEVNNWMRKAREEWKGQVPSYYNGVLSQLDLDELWELVITRSLTKDQFCEWLNQRAWDRANEMLGLDADKVKLEEVERDAEEEEDRVGADNAVWESFLEEQADAERVLSEAAARKLSWTVKATAADDVSSDGTLEEDYEMCA